MEIVSQRSEAEIDAEFAERRLRWALRELAANILRVRRGAGRSHDIGSQCLQVVECIKACHASKLVRLTALDLESMLRDDSTGESGHDSRARTDQEEARDVIVSGALQIEASRLIFQRTQQVAGEREMANGVRELLEAREREREKWAAEQQVARTNPKFPRKKPAAEG